VISIVDPSGREIARGITNYNSDALQLIKGHKSREIKEILAIMIMMKLFTVTTLHLLSMADKLVERRQV